MNTIIISKDHTGYYDLLNGSTDQAKLLGYFLLDDVNDGAKKWKDWAINPQYTDVQGNFCGVSKRANKMHVFFLHDNEVVPAVLDFSEFINLLDQWDPLYKSQQFQTIIITIDYDGKVAVDGKNEK